MLEKLQSNRNLIVSRWRVQRQLHRLGYENVLPRGTPMLTNEQNERRVQWAMAHKADDWSRTVFSDETLDQLFRNTIRRWSKYAQEEKKKNSEEQTKDHGMGCI